MIIGTTNLVINEIGAVFNVRIEGDTDANLFFTDATNDKVGVGTASPAEKLDVVGKIKLSDNLVIGTSGKGIDFSATSGTGTSELLADYEEGTWTPVATSATGAITTYTSDGFYTKVGRIVTVQGFVLLTDVGTAAGALNIASFPFTAINISGVAASGNASETDNTGVTYSAVKFSNNTTGSISTLTNTPIVWFNNYRYSFTLTYMV
jgi:hypothetical protein